MAAAHLPPPGRSSRRPDVATLLAARDGMRVISHVPGRIRLRLSATLLTPAMCSRLAGLEGALRRAPGVLDTAFVFAAHSLTIRYDPDVLSAPVWERLLQADPAAAAALLETLLESAE